MSLAIFAKKSKTKYSDSLTQNGVFSINSARKEQSRIGETYENSVVRPLFIKEVDENGNPIPRGYGGLPPKSTRRCGTTECPGSWPQFILCNNGTTSVGGDVNHISTKNTKGYIESSVTFGLPIWAKTFNPLDHSQSSYIRKLKVYESTIIKKGESYKIGECNGGGGDCNIHYIGTRKHSTNTHFKNKHAGAIPSGEYIDTWLLKNNCLPPPPCKAPFPMILNKTSCRDEYLTPQEAIDGGALPVDWMNCKKNTKPHNKKHGCMTDLHVLHPRTGDYHKLAYHITSDWSDYYPIKVINQTNNDWFIGDNSTYTYIMPPKNTDIPNLDFTYKIPFSYIRKDYTAPILIKFNFNNSDEKEIYYASYVTINRITSSRISVYLTDKYLNEAQTEPMELDLSDINSKDAFEIDINLYLSLVDEETTKNIDEQISFQIEIENTVIAHDKINISIRHEES